MRKSYKYRVFLSKSQETKVSNMFSMCRHLYNWSLDERKSAYENEGKSLSYNEQQNSLPKLKKERPWFKGVYSLSLQDVLRRLDKAYLKFFREKKGYPKYKKKGQWSSLSYPDYRKRPTDGFLPLSKIGTVKINYHREIPIDAQIKTLTLTKEGGKWFVCFSLDLPDPKELKQEASHSIGIDMGLSSFIFTSDGLSFSAPKYLRKKLKILARLQKKFQKSKKGTSIRRKILKALQKVHYRIKCLRKDFYYKKAHQLLSISDLIVHEKLDINNMIRKKPEDMSKKGKSGLNKSIYDAGWGSFLNILCDVARSLGKQVIGVDPSYTTQDCSSCGNRVKKALSVRTHECESCGFVSDRDHNAAKNILRLGLESLGVKSLEAPTITPSV
jgi:putative transposase